MKKLSNKIKTIYTLTAILVLSLCMMLVPVSSKPANAVEISNAASSITVQSAYIQVSNEVDSNNEISEFAIMFKAKINLSDYNVITNNGQSKVKFGMLIGPTASMGSVTDYASAISADFASISNVGTRYSGAVQHINFGDSEQYIYTAGIVYNQEKLTQAQINLKEAVNIELTAIPFYSIDGNPVAIIDNQKSCTPKQILSETFIKEQDAEITNIPEKVVETYVGEVNTMPGDHYICRDTGRLMSSSTVGGTLLPINAASAGDTVYLYGKKQTSINTLEIDDDMLENLPMYGETNLVVYKQDGTVNKYKVAVAERVITRFADVDASKIGVNATTGALEYPTGYSDIPDYLATAKVTVNTSTNKVSARSYQSIFEVKNTSVKFLQGSKLSDSLTDRSQVYRSLNTSYEGLYVLASNLIIPSSHDYIVDTGVALNSGAGNVTNATGADNDRARLGMVGPIAWAGFNGTLDGRGYCIDMKTRAVNGVVPTAFGATIKNVAFYGLQAGLNGGGITSHARATTFENIYAEVTKATNNNADLNKALLMNVQDCDFKNFVAKVDIINDTVMTGTLPDYKTGNAGTGVGQGVTTSGVFTFRAYTDLYFDGTNVRSTYSSAQFTNEKGEFFIDNISLNDVKKLFPSMIDTEGKAVYNLYNVADQNNSMAAPLASKYAKMQDKSQASAFTGTTGVNVYALGTSPLYVGYDYLGEYYAKGSTGYYGAQLGATSSATVFVNETPKLTNGQDAEVNWRVSGEDYVAPKTYKMSEIAGSKFAFNNDNTYTLGEIIYRGKLYRHGAARMNTLLNSKAANEVLEVRFINQEGFYDVANTTEMATYVKQQTVPFDSAYWNVNNGVVTWKNAL